MSIASFMGRWKRPMSLWQDIRYSLWFIPTIIVVIAAALAVTAVAIDSSFGPEIVAHWPPFLKAGADGTRGVLEVVAGAMITVAGLTFSITVVVLSLAATQYTPRVIRTFMGNRPTQVVLGVFVGVFVYCLIVLRSVQAGSNPFVPTIAVTIAVLLALIGVGFLVYFIHHVASSIQASTIVSSVAGETLHAVDVMFPDCLDSNEANEDKHLDYLIGKYKWHRIPSSCTGYLRTIDTHGLASYAEKRGAIIRMEKAVGDFLTEGLNIASITILPDDVTIDDLNARISVGEYRTVEQDIAVGIRQLVDIALRAMSPSNNDTTTASMCIDYLSAVLARLAQRRIPADDSFPRGTSNVIIKAVGFKDFLSDAFSQIGQTAGDKAIIYIRLLEALDMLACLTPVNSRRQDIANQVRLIAEYASGQVCLPDQRRVVETHAARALASCEY